MTLLERLRSPWLVGCICVLAVLVADATSATAVHTSNRSVVPRGAYGLRQKAPSPNPHMLIATPSPRPGAIVTGVNTDTPDPFILHARGGYYMYSSEAFWSGKFYPVMVAFSQDPRRFPPPKPAMLNAPAWTAQALTSSPDVVKNGSKYEMYFDSMSTPALGGEQCLGIAVAANPGGPFVPDPKPLHCDPDHFGAIDPRVFTDNHGTRWLLWKSNDNTNPSSQRSPSAIVSQLLSRDGKALIGAPHYLLRADQPWQRGVIEAPDLVHTHGRYWIFYSGGHYTTPTYGIGIGLCQGPIGPCKNLSAQPWLSSNAQGHGPGEASVLADSHGRWWLVYNINDGEQRPGDTRPAAIAPISFTHTYPTLTY